MGCSATWASPKGAGAAPLAACYTPSHRWPLADQVPPRDCPSSMPSLVGALTPVQQAPIYHAARFLIVGNQPVASAMAGASDWRGGRVALCQKLGTGVDPFCAWEPLRLGPQFSCTMGRSFRNWRHRQYCIVRPLVAAVGAVNADTDNKKLAAVGWNGKWGHRPLYRPRSQQATGPSGQWVCFTTRHR